MRPLRISRTVEKDTASCGLSVEPRNAPLPKLYPWCEVTRLEAFAAALTREMLDTYDLREPPVTMADVGANIAAARAVAERRIREFLAQAADQYAGAAMTETWAEEDADAPCLEKPHTS